MYLVIKHTHLIFKGSYVGIYSFKTDILKCRQNPSLMTSAQLRRTSEVLGKLLGWLIPPPGLQAPQCIHVWDSSESK